MAAPLPTPSFDWNSPDRAQSFKEFRQLSNMWFNVKHIKKEDQFNYIVMWSGKEGLRMFNTWGLDETQCADPTNIWTRFENQVQPKENFRIHRLEFQRFRQDNSESIEDFVLRCKSKGSKCLFQSAAMLEERIIEVLISGVRYPEVQKLLLAKDVKLTLDEAITMAKAHEASTVHMKQLESIGQTNIHAVQNTKNEFRCRNCDCKHRPRACPAFHSVCGACGFKGHWRKCCRQQQKKKEGNDFKTGPKRNEQNSFRTGPKRNEQNSFRTGPKQAQWTGPKRNEQNRNRQVPRRDIHHLDVSDTSDTFEELNLETIIIADDLRIHSVPDNDTTQMRDELFANLQISLDHRPGNTP